MEHPSAAGQSPQAESLAWYCLCSQPKHENIAAIHLRKHALVEVFSPRIRFQRPRLKSRAWTTEALFPGYLFARFNLAERCREIQHAHAVRGILRFGEKYAALPATIIDQFRAMMGPDEISVIDQAVKPGQDVIVSDGPFLGLQTVITCYLPAKDRVKVLMNILGRETEVELPTSSLVSALPERPFKL